MTILTGSGSVEILGVKNPRALGLEQKNVLKIPNGVWLCPDFKVLVMYAF